MKMLIHIFLILCVAITATSSFAQKESWLILPNALKAQPCVKAQFMKFGHTASSLKTTVGVLKGSRLDNALKKKCKLTLPQSAAYKCCCKKHGRCDCLSDRAGYCTRCFFCE